MARNGILVTNNTREFRRIRGLKVDSCVKTPLGGDYNTRCAEVAKLK